MKRSSSILVAALRISTFSHVARVAREEDLMASSVRWRGIGGGGLCTSVKVTMRRRPWATPLTAKKVKMPDDS